MCPASEFGLPFPNQAGNVEFHNHMFHCGLWETEIAARLSLVTEKKDEDGNPSTRRGALIARRMEDWN